MTEMSGSAEDHLLRGNALYKTGNHADALLAYQRAIALKPNFSEAYQNCGLVYHDIGDFERALGAFDRAIDLNPLDAWAFSNYGSLLKQNERWADAQFCFEKAIALCPTEAKFHYNLGNLFREAQAYARSIPAYAKALDLKPDDLDSLGNLALALRHLREFDAAMRCYERAIDIDPANAEMHYGRSSLNLLHGRFAYGWDEYEWRTQTRQFANGRDFPVPVWRGEASLTGKTLLVHHEQGVGDTIQFCRYVPFIEREFGATILFAPQAKLLPLMASLQTGARLVDLAEALPAFDYHCPLMSLPLACRTTVESIPSAVSYLACNDERRTRLRKAMDLKPHELAIGISWHTSDQNTGKARSIPLEVMLESLAKPGRVFVDLQYGLDHSATDATALAQKVRLHRSAFVNPYDDIEGLAALISACDQVITIDNTTAHLAGALGQRVGVLLPAIPDWRWMLDRTDSPWYPTMQLFRQKAEGDWWGPLQELQDWI